MLRRLDTLSVNSDDDDDDDDDDDNDDDDESNVHRDEFCSPARGAAGPWLWRAHSAAEPQRRQSPPRRHSNNCSPSSATASAFNGAKASAGRRVPAVSLSRADALSVCSVGSTHVRAFSVGSPCGSAAPSCTCGGQQAVFRRTDALSVTSVQRCFSCDSCALRGACGMCVCACVCVCVCVCVRVCACDHGVCVCTELR